MDEHCVPGALTYATYYGTSRKIGAEELEKYDVVLTTYQTVVNDDSGGSKVASSGSSKRKKTGETLKDIRWKRIIIDEGHQIRNPSTKAAVAVSALWAERRWVLTGTPIVGFSFRAVSELVNGHRFTAELPERSWFSFDILENLPPLGPKRFFQPTHLTSIERWCTDGSRIVTGAHV